MLQDSNLSFLILEADKECRKMQVFPKIGRKFLV